MFNLCKSCYQAVLRKQRWNDLNQQCAEYQTAGENAFHLFWTEITEIIFSIVKVVLEQSRETLLRGILKNENWWPKRGPYQCGPPMRIVCKANYKNFFQMTMFFLAYLVAFLVQLHITRNYVFTGNTSAEQLPLQSK